MTKPKRIYLPHDEFNFARLFLQHREIYYIAGTNSLTVPSRKEKYIMFSRPDGTKVCREWTDETGETLLLTPGEAARAELRKTFPGLRRVGWQSDHVRLLDWRWPMLFTGSYKGDGAYIDLKGAYHQLYSRLWLDTAFPCGYGSLSLAGIADNLKDWKGARNSLIGITAAREAIGVRGTKTVHLQTRNPYLSPGLWATIQGILNELAWLAEKRGACYIATDGYIFKSEDDASYFEETLYELGLRYRRLNGQVHIKNWGAYKIKGKETQTYKRSSGNEVRGFRSIRLFDTEFPNHLSRWWAKSIPHYSKQIWKIGGIKEWQMV